MLENHRIIPETLNIPGTSVPSPEGVFTLALYTLIATVIIGVLLFLAWFLGQKTRSPLKNSSYESGVIPTGSSRLVDPVPFYLVAIFFIVFDLEIVFVLAWAVAYDLLGWAGFAQIGCFVAILFLGLVYLWRVGALDWSPPAARARRFSVTGGKDR
ncbi:MAG: NADH-quinone oxidoreductase subunit A [Desulfuromonadales bacterium]|nr:NADH-quinone oxidoreductase subunit A [Desulfuromonadales bacterium]